LQKRLNRVDSLIELALMCNASGKWIWPKTQTSPGPTGSPNDVIEWDPIGEGKSKPEFVSPQPFAPIVMGVRQSILADFNAIGLTEAVSTGAAPTGGGPTAFRALAYLGSKAAEQINTQRVLWELGHQLRYEKCLLMAKLFWDEPRKAKVAGNNGKYKVQNFVGSDLKGQYDIEFVPDSSRPKSIQEKQAAVAMLFQAGLVNPTDPAVREYLVDMANVDGLNLTDHLQYEKAERMLEQLKRGEIPMVVPGINWQIVQKIWTDYTLTEDFESQPPQMIEIILQALAMVQMQIAQQQDAAMAAAAKDAAMTPEGQGAPAPALPGANGPSPHQKQIGDALHAHAAQQQNGPGHVLNGAGGGAPAATQQAASAEGQNVASQLP
jgi:hypothetical protein